MSNELTCRLGPRCWALCATTMLRVVFVCGAATSGGLADEQPTLTPPGPKETVQTRTTKEGVEYGVWGRIDNTLQPTLMVLSGTIDGTLASPYFRQCGNQLARESGWLLVSIDLPCHGTQHREGESGLSGWRKQVERGEDFVATFNKRMSNVLTHLIDNGYSDPKRIAACGTSRGGFLALQFAAADQRVVCAAGFAPVTDLAKLSEFTGMDDDALTKQLSLEQQANNLAERHVWIGIGDQDQRVNTDAAIHLARQLTFAKCHVELHVLPEPRGHTTPKGSAEMVARWISEIIGN